ncbi:MAG: glutamate synthase large subunit [Candidatus Omnitrophica bacterium]|nr:glutamate synthase large subunit [Candidatus Omnitrophota bacterium]
MAAFPKKQGLYDPQFEHDSCGVGFVCNIKGIKSHSIVSDGLQILKNLEHRGAVGADPLTGDGAGILMQMPDAFFRKECGKSRIELPEYGSYGAGLVFLPQDKEARTFCEKVFTEIIEQEGQKLLWFRTVPVNDSTIGETAKHTQPVIKQIFIARADDVSDQLLFERKLFIIRKQVERVIRESNIKEKNFFYVASLSSRTFIYKGLLMTAQVETFFPELRDTDMISALALVHSRYSTNTFPTWDLAQPFRFIAHNGEINTLRGNFNWMKAREGLLKSDVFGDDIEKIKPVLTAGVSDSATIDNAFELLVLSGREVCHAMMMLIPIAWEANELISAQARDFYKYHACFAEPWDGPAAIAFTDGKGIGAVLDRNGLRPARYIITKDDRVVMASEVGVLDIAQENISVSGRLEPGKMFYVDTQQGRIISDKEIKESITSRQPYSKWLKKNLVELDELKAHGTKEKIKSDLSKTLMAFGYTREDMRTVLAKMALTGVEPSGAMGNDTPLAILDKDPKLLYFYFKQLFAQVTNPAIDPIREECVMSLESFVGPQRNILEETPQHCHKIRVDNPILSDEQLCKFKGLNEKGFKAKTLSVLFDKKTGNFRIRLDEICNEAEEAISLGYTHIILSDRGVDDGKVALPMLLVMGAVHHHLVSKTLRTQLGIIVESGEPREVFHFALLFGYGADCINPYLAYHAIESMVSNGEIECDRHTAVKNYRKAVCKGIFKILSKMGISTLSSYRGAQIFEALGIGDEVINKCFFGTPSRIGGIDFDIIEKETVMRHDRAFDVFMTQSLPSGGIYQWKKDGALHLWTPESIACLQDATAKGDYALYKKFSDMINSRIDSPVTLRNMLRFKESEAISLDEVEPAETIMKRFVTGAMSFGSISRGAHETLAIVMNRLGGRSNTGEGGEDPARFASLPNGDSKRSAIKQVASGRFGVVTNYLVNSDEIQIKIAQGAKPGEGGQLPGHKVSVTIAKTRYTTPGVTLISPPPHHDIYSIEDLAQLIFDLKNTNPRARISVKLVSEVGVGTIAAGVAKGHADMILISGGDGGTGASPLSSIYHAGLPWELGLSETHQTLVLNNLRSRVRLQTDGQMRTGYDVAVAAMLGAEEYGFCTAALIVMGCVMLRHCNLNNCSVGIATQDDILQSRFAGKIESVINYFKFVVRETREIMASLGIKKLDDMIGRTDLLYAVKSDDVWKAKEIDFSKILYKPEHADDVAIFCQCKQDHAIDKVLDRRLIELAQKAIARKEPIRKELDIKNINRTTGAMLSGEVCYRLGPDALNDDTIWFKFNGVAGQSFGAWLVKGVTFEMEGLVNDYIGKGISGGKIIVYPGRKTTYESNENIIVGNTSFYGAISGQAYIRGKAGERFCIRNSGLNVVVEGVGDHGCEYMTGGKVIVLGETGRNFAAGMSGGIAYVYDVSGRFSNKCNMEMVEFEPLEEDDETYLRSMLNNHVKYTGSNLASGILENFDDEKKIFIKVMPIEYKRILGVKKDEKRLGLTEVSDG